MKLDDVDLKILQTIYEESVEGEDLTTTFIAKEVYDTDNGVKLSTLDARVNNRLSKMSDYGIVSIDESGRSYTYELKDSVIFGQAELDVDTYMNGGKNYKFDTEGMVFVKTEGGFYGFTYIREDDDDKE